MAITFSGKELLEMAIQIERNGFDFYSDLTHIVKDEKVKTLVEWLTQEENGHIKRFEDILSRFREEDIDMSPAEIEEYALYIKALADAGVFPSDLDAREAAIGIKSEKDAIDMAIGFEKDSLLFLHGMRPLISKGDLAAIDELAREEMLHLKKLVELKKER